MSLCRVSECVKCKLNPPLHRCSVDNVLCSTGYYCSEKCYNADATDHESKCTAIELPRGRRLRGKTNFEGLFGQLYEALILYTEKRAEMMRYSLVSSEEHLNAYTKTVQELADRLKDVTRTVNKFEGMLSVTRQGADAKEVESRVRRVTQAILAYVNESTSPEPDFNAMLDDKTAQALLDSLRRILEIDILDPAYLRAVSLWNSLDKSLNLRDAVQRFSDGITSITPWPERSLWRRNTIEKAKEFGKTFDEFHTEKRKE